MMQYIVSILVLSIILIIASAVGVKESGDPQKPNTLRRNFLMFTLAVGFISSCISIYIIIKSVMKKPPTPRANMGIQTNNPRANVGIQAQNPRAMSSIQRRRDC